jgi:hypothetical protein
MRFIEPMENKEEEVVVVVKENINRYTGNDNLCETVVKKKRDM